MELSKKALKWAEDGSNTAEVYQAYINIVGEEYATMEEADEAYAGQWASDEEFAQNLADESGLIDNDLQWPYTCIDWERASRDLMYDYSESDGYYFRNL